MKAIVISRWNLIYKGKNSFYYISKAEILFSQMLLQWKNFLFKGLHDIWEKKVKQVWYCISKCIIVLETLLFSRMALRAKQWISFNIFTNCTWMKTFSLLFEMEF